MLTRPNILAHTTNQTYLFVKLFRMFSLASQVDCEIEVRKEKGLRGEECWQYNEGARVSVKITPGTGDVEVNSTQVR